MSYKYRNFRSDYNIYTIPSQSFLITEFGTDRKFFYFYNLSRATLTSRSSNVRVLFVVQVYSLFLAHEE